MWTPEQDAAAEVVADVIVAVAVARHPGDPAKIAECAMALTESLVPAGHYHDPAGRYDYCDDPRCPRSYPVSVESPSMSPAELERRLASPGAKWDR